MREEIVISWAEWQMSRAAKRANLVRLGLDKPSRRVTDFSSAGKRLRKAFDGQRAPSFGPADFPPRDPEAHPPTSPDRTLALSKGNLS